MKDVMQAASFGRGEFRRLWLSERELFKHHLLRLDPLTRKQRFGTAVNDGFLENYAITTFGVGGMVYAYIEDGVVRGAAELRGLEDLVAQTGEAAFSVESGWRRRGIGSALFGRLITAARNRGIRTLYLTCLPENAAMRRMATKLEADVVGGYGDVEGVIATGGPTPFTVLDEALDHAQSFATLALTIQSSFWPARFFAKASGA